MKPIMNESISRRRMLHLSGSVAAVTALSSCSFLSTDPANSSNNNSGPPQANGKEAPSLADQVAKGSIPPVEQRLPATPLTVQPLKQVGSYGGSWNTALLGPADTAWLGRTVAYDRLVTWDLNWENIVPNIAESFEAAPDAKTYTFKLRPGMKWSDGEPFTSADVMFWYESVFSNQKLTPGFPIYLQTKKQPVVVTAPDETTVVFTFGHPNGVFLQWLATYDGGFDLLPKHYLSQFHPDFNDDVDKIAKEEKAPDWVELFSRKRDLYENPELPRLHGWLPKNAISDGTRMTFERNPYYFKIDSAGSQLPYLDQIVYSIFSEEEAILLQASAGEFDFHSRHINIPRNKPVLAENAAKYNYKLIEMPTASMNTMTICPNLTHATPARRKMLQDKDFRIALSHAINRQEIIDVVYQGQGEPWQVAPRPEAPFADPEMAKQYTEHDPDKANQLLDQGGYRRGGDGIRVDSDGKPISLSILVQSRYFEMADACQMIVEDWAEIGIRLRVENIDGTLFDTRVEANNYDFAVDTGEYGYIDGVVDPRYYFPSFLSGASYAVLWYRWYAGTTPAEEPPEAMRRQMALYRDELQSKITAEDQYAVMKQIVTIAKEEFWLLGTSLPANSYGIVRNDLHNVPDTMWEASRYPTPGPSVPAQWYTDRRA